MNSKGFIGVACAVILGASVAGCGGSADSASSGRPSAASPQAAATGTESEQSGGTQGFNGPWGAVLRDEYQNATSDLVRNALADGNVTQPEVAAIQSQFTECMASRDHVATWTPGDDRYQVALGDEEPSQAESDALGADAQECEAQAGVSVVSLYFRMLGNPKNADQATIMAACFVRSGIAPKGYTANDYKRDASADPPPSFFSDTRANSCSQNPLGS